MRLRPASLTGLVVPAVIVIVLLTVVFVGMRITAGVRAYVGGESLWSKAQKTGVASLYRYAVTRDEADFTAYREAQRVPDADRRARLELQGPRKDRAVAAREFVLGANHPEDAPIMVWVFLNLGTTPYFGRAIEIWTRADSLRDALDVEAERLHAVIRADAGAGPTLDAVLDRIAHVDSLLTEEESAFSATLGEGARWARGVITVTVALTGLLLGVLGSILIGRLARQQRLALELERARTAERLVAEATLRERDEQLRQVQKLEAVGRLAGGVAHDFNNLLTIIHGNLDLVRSVGGLDADTEAALDDALRAADRAAGLTAQLLTFSRRQVAQVRIVQLNEIVAETKSMVQRVIGEGIELVTELQQDLAPVAADPSQLSQVILNLVLNARDAMPDGGTVRVSTSSEPGDWSVLEVSDEGAGMDEATRERVFEPFFTTKEVGRGTGLGLATVFGIVGNLGGTIEVRSAPGRGTTFRVRLRAQQWPEPAEDAAAPTDDVVGTETVLVVEDEPSVRSLAERVLAARGFAVRTARNGVEALELLGGSGARVDLVVSDVVMPEMGGRALAQAMRVRGHLIPVVFMSGYTANADPLVCPTGRPAVLLAKPFTPTELAAKVRAVLDRDASVPG